MEKNIFTTDLGSLIGDNPIEVDGVDDGASLIPGAFEQRTEKEEPDKELEDDKDLIDLEEDSEQEDTEEEETEEDMKKSPLILKKSKVLLH